MPSAERPHRRTGRREPLSDQVIPWIIFAAAVAVMLAVDLGMSRGGREMGFRTAAVWSAVWIALGIAFTSVVWNWGGRDLAEQYVAGYLIEKSLSVDNLFVFVMVFGSFGIAAAYQRKVLLWGIIGAMLMRAVFIVGGVGLIKQFHAVVYVFGAFLVFTSVQMIRHRGKELDPQRNPVVRLARRLAPVDMDYRGPDFTVRRDGRRTMTPLLLALLAIESADVVFAVDSVPAVLAVSTDFFVVFTSNVFAILGLRSLYFALVGFVDRFEYLVYGLSAVLAFVGFKMLLSHWLEVPVPISLGVIVALVAAAIVFSLVMTRRRGASAHQSR
jgi:tellurite resistance protein TerC